MTDETPQIETQTPPPAKQQRGFGRLIAKDPRDLRYAMAPRLAPTTRVYRYWNPPIVLDQGYTSQCVAYSTVGWLLAGPVRNTEFHNRVQQDLTSYLTNLYRECQRVDEWPGEDYEGTSVRACFKLMKEKGFATEYVWAFDAETVARHVLETGPCVVGTWWKSDMDRPDDEGYIHASGGNRGGHAWLISGFSRLKRCPDGSTGAFRMQNSWGIGWGDRGRAWISFSDLDALIRDDGEAVAAVEVDLDVPLVA